MRNKLIIRTVKNSVCVLCILSAVSVSAGASDTIEYLNDGNILFTGEKNGAAKNTDVTISVVKSDYDYDDESQWIKADADSVVYCDNSEITADGKYSFSFTLDENGLYDVYIGFENIENPDIFKIEYTEKAGNEAAAESFKKAIQTGSKADIEQLLKSKRKELRIYTDLYSEEACGAAAELVYNYFTGLKDPEAIDGEAIREITQRAYAVDKLNNNALVSLEQYKDILNLTEEKLAKYYSSKNESDIKNMLTQKTITSIEEYNERLTEAVIISAINNCDGTKIIQDIFTDFKTECGTENKTITDSLCSAVATKGNFKSLGELKTFIAGYKDEKKSNNNGGGSGNGSGGAPGKNTGVIIPSVDSGKNQNVNVKIFDDIPLDFWANDAIESLYKKNIVTGKTDTMFYPNDKIKREEFVTLLVKAFKFDMVDDDFHFDDVPEDAWYYEYVRSAYLGYVVNGISENMFGSGRDITRQDLSVMIYNAAKAAAVDLPAVKEKAEFSDESDIADYARAAVESLQKAGIISGYEDNTFKPYGSATRAEAAAMIFRVLQFLNN